MQTHNWSACTSSRPLASSPPSLLPQFSAQRLSGLTKLYLKQHGRATTSIVTATTGHLQPGHGVVLWDMNASFTAVYLRCIKRGSFGPGDAAAPAASFFAATIQREQDDNKRLCNQLVHDDSPIRPPSSLPPACLLLLL